MRERRAAHDLHEEDVGDEEEGDEDGVTVEAEDERARDHLAPALTGHHLEGRGGGWVRQAKVRRGKAR